MVKDKLTHLNEAGEAHMVDIGGKPTSERFAIARSRLLMSEQTLELIERHGIAKGDVYSVARLAGIMAAKRTWELIPLCHPLDLTEVGINLRGESVGEGRAAVEIEARVKSVGRTGVEMEALTAASIAALTVYDMCKSVDREMVMESTYLARKEGGVRGLFIHPREM